MIEITLILLARMIEAYRDAEIFQQPLDPRSFLWHLLKYPQYFAWVAAGTIFGMEPTKIGLAWLGGGILLAWPVFELALKFFRATI